MKITNRCGLPEPIVRAVQNDPYTKGDADYSATELINPVQQVILKNRYWSELSEDVSDRIWSLLGQAWHHILERAEVKDALQEERIFASVSGRKISGAADLYHNETISDYKTTSVWTAIYGSRTKEWTEQLNILAYLFRTIGFEVKALEVVAIYRDWSATEAARYADRYPPKAERVVLELWDTMKQHAFIVECLKSLIAAEKLTDDQLPPCTDEQMWAKADVWKVMKKGATRSTKNCSTEEEAKAAVENRKKPSEYEVMHQPVERTRCERYCPVKDYCSQFMAYKIENPEVTP